MTWNIEFLKGAEIAYIQCLHGSSLINTGCCWYCCLFFTLLRSSMTSIQRILLVRLLKFHK